MSLAYSSNNDNLEDQRSLRVNAPLFSIIIHKVPHIQLKQACRNQPCGRGEEKYALTNMTGQLPSTLHCKN
jgi:hypothetical protein